MANVVDRLGGASSSLAFKAPCRLATTANVTLSGMQTLDGVLPTSSEHVDLRRILVKNQNTASENGIYIMDTGTWERAKDFDGAGDFRRGTRVFVWGGSTQSGSYLVDSSMDPSTFTFDTDDITFALASGVDVTNFEFADGEGIYDDSSNEQLIFQKSSTGAANYFEITNSTAGSAPQFSANGSDAAVDLKLTAKSTGAVTSTSVVKFDAALTSTAITASGTITASSAVNVTGSFTVGASFVRGHTSAIAMDDSITPNTQTHGTNTGDASYAGARWSNDASSPRIVMAKSRGTSIGSHAVVQSGDSLGRIQFEGSDGTAFQGGAYIEAFVDGTPGSSDMPGRLSLAVTSDGSGSATEKLRIDSTGTQVTGLLQAVTGTTITSGGVIGRGILLYGSTLFGIYAGSGAPTIAAGQGSLYMRTDGASSLTRAYIQTSGSTNTWAGLLTTA